jgi:RNA polymerase sigma factor (sigma-70 family)
MTRDPLTVRQRHRVLANVRLVGRFMGTGRGRFFAAVLGYDDARQCCYLGLIEAARRYDGTSKFGWYAFLWMRAKCQDAWELENKHAGRESGVPPDELPAPAEREPVDCGALLAGLDPRDARALSLVYLSGMTHERAAVVMGVSRGRVQQRVAQGLRQIRERATA